MTDKIKARIAGRNHAVEVLGMIEIPDEHAESFCDAFWKAVKSFAEDRLPNTEKPERPSRPTMSDEEAKRFENRTIHYGEFSGRQYSDVPIERLVWYHEQSEQLGAYLRSEIGQRRQEES